MVPTVALLHDAADREDDTIQVWLDHSCRSLRLRERYAVGARDDLSIRAGPPKIHQHVFCSRMDKWIAIIKEVHKLKRCLQLIHYFTKCIVRQQFGIARAYGRVVVGRAGGIQAANVALGGGLNDERVRKSRPMVYTVGKIRRFTLI